MQKSIQNLPITRPTVPRYTRSLYKIYLFFLILFNYLSATKAQQCWCPKSNRLWWFSLTYDTILVHWEPGLANRLLALCPLVRKERLTIIQSRADVWSEFPVPSNCCLSILKLPVHINFRPKFLTMQDCQRSHTLAENYQWGSNQSYIA